MTFTARFRGRFVQAQAAYAWSHAIDNQSDPLRGDFFDLKFTGISQAASSTASASFTRQFDSRSDRGNSDFDQRHNLVFFSIWDVPRALQTSKLGWMLRDWKVSQLAAVRSGLPFTVNVPSPFAPDRPLLYNNRADLVSPDVFLNSPGEGGRQVLNPAAFRAPAAGTLGTLGRNALAGPGFFNLDLSVSRSFPLAQLGEAGRLTFRADGFNVLNHANLNNPESFLTSSNFGVASYGRLGVASAFPAIAPLNETARQVQLIVRVEF
jgi:hypothetical protein